MKHEKFDEKLGSYELFYMEIPYQRDYLSDLSDEFEADEAGHIADNQALTLSDEQVSALARDQLANLDSNAAENSLISPVKE